MLDQALLMRRAIKYCCDENGLAPDTLHQMPTLARQSFQELAFAVQEDMLYNQLKYFRPFDHQKEFFKTGLTSDRRGILAANRIGKTVSTCYEIAMHLTGNYPLWWEGRRYDKPVTIMAAGEGWEQVSKVLQAELLGTHDVKINDNLGTGAIPLKNIKQATMRNDGANCISCEIKHKNGYYSTLLFANYTQEVRQMQGFKLDIAVFDEQPPDDFFSEVVTRTATTQGQVLCSFTPLKGLNGLVSKFWTNEKGYEHIRVAWDDVPEYDLWGEPFFLKSTREALIIDYLPHERDARTKGIPVMGKGAVFQIRNWPTYKTGDYDFKNSQGLCRVIALDLGLVNDSTVITLMYYDPNEQEAWLHTQIVVTGTEEANPMNYINHLMRPEVFGTPIVLPADGNTQGRYTMSSQSIRTMFESYELNVHPDAIMNPPDEQGRRTNHKSFGINSMRQMLELGTLHVNENCTAFLKEAQNYFVDAHGRFSDPDDCIDSARYALIACLQGIAEPFDGRSPQQRFKDAKHNVRVSLAQKNSDSPEWKKVYSASGN